MSVSLGSEAGVHGTALPLRMPNAPGSSCPRGSWSQDALSCQVGGRPWWVTLRGPASLATQCLGPSWGPLLGQPLTCTDLALSPELMLSVVLKRIHRSILLSYSCCSYLTTHSEYRT